MAEKKTTTKKAATAKVAEPKKETAKKAAPAKKTAAKKAPAKNSGKKNSAIGPKITDPNEIKRRASQVVITEAVQ